MNTESSDFIFATFSNPHAICCDHLRFFNFFFFFEYRDFKVAEIHVVIENPDLGGSRSTVYFDSVLFVALASKLLVSA